MPLSLTARVDARPVAVARVLLACGTIITVLELWSAMRRIGAGGLRLSLLWDPIPIGALSSGVWAAVALLLCVLLLLGVRARESAAGSSILLVVAVLWDHQLYGNNVWLAVLLTSFMAFAEPAGAWSLQSRWSGRRDTPVWPLFLMAFQVSVVYLFAALSKINENYLSGVVLLERSGLPLPADLLPVAAVASIATEMALAFCLWVPGLRVVAAGVGLTLHASIVILLDAHVVFIGFALTTLSVYPLFLTRRSWTRAG